MSRLARFGAPPRHDLPPLVEAPEVADLPDAKQAKWVRTTSKLVRKQEGAA